MNVAQLHLFLNHFPLAGFIASFGLLLYALWRGRSEARRIALAGIVISGLLILPVMLSGSGSEEMVEHLPGVREAVIGRHEEAASIALVLALVAAAAALVTLIGERRSRSLARGGLLATMLLAAIAMVGIGWTSHLGGAIRHPEIATAWGGFGGDGTKGNEAGKHGEADEGRESRAAQGGVWSDAAAAVPGALGGGMGGTAGATGVPPRAERDDD